MASLDIIAPIGTGAEDADALWDFASGALIAVALGVVIGATWDPLAATAAALLGIVAGVAITLWRAR